MNQVDALNMSFTVGKTKTAPLQPETIEIGDKLSSMFDERQFLVEQGNKMLSAEILEVGKLSRLMHNVFSYVVYSEVNANLTDVHAVEDYLDKSTSMASKFEVDLKPFFDKVSSMYKAHSIKSALHDSVRALVDIPISFIDESGVSSGEIVLYPEIDINDETKICTFYVNKTMLPQFVPGLIDLKESHYLSITQLFDLKNKHAEKLYDILNGKMQDVGFLRSSNKEIVVSISQLKAIFKIDKTSTTYQNRYFTRRVLEPCREEISSVTDISFDYRMERDGRTYNSVVFYNITRKKGAVLDNADVIDVRPEELQPVSGVGSKPYYDERMENEKNDKEFFVLLAEHEGFTPTQTFELLELFPNVKLFKKAIDVFRAKTLNEKEHVADKMEFFRIYADIVQ